MRRRVANPESLIPVVQYVWSARYIDAAVLCDVNTDADGLCDDGRYYYLSDAGTAKATDAYTGADGKEGRITAASGKTQLTALCLYFHWQRGVAA